MITCTYCGNANPDTRRECQYCGAPLARTKRSEYGPESQQQVPSMQPVQPMSSVQPQQPVQPAQSTQTQASELPTWLQSLRSDAPVRPSEPSNFSAADFMEESDLPRWMQPNSGPDEEPDEEQHERQGMGSLRPSSFPGPNTDEGYVRNISAHDLIDEQMLPDWMKSGGAASASGRPEMPLSGQRNISASGLIQQDSVPDWMRNFPQDQSGTAGQFEQSPGTSQSAPSYQEQVPQAFQNNALSLFSAHDLIDQQSLPAWLQEQSGQGSQGNQGYPGSQQGQQGQQGQQMGASPAWNATAYQQQAGESAKGFSASSLVDMNSLPSWMSEANMSNMSAPSQQQGQQNYHATPAPQQQGQAMWQNMPSQQQTPSQQAGLSAASFIDVNALPDWLRAASEQGQPAAQHVPTSPTQGMNGAYGVQGQGYGTYGTQQRADNVRVPSRPRGEIGMNEGNEAAANAFSSVLGVASHAPQFTQQNPQGSQGLPYSAPSPSPVSASSPQYPGFAAPSPMNAAPQPSYMNTIGVAQPASGAQPVGNYPMNGQQLGAQSMQSAGQYNQYNQYNQAQSQPVPPMQQRQPMQQQPSSQLNQEKAQKRGGLFEAIRNFFFRQS